MPIYLDLNRCIADTEAYVGIRAANRLRPWVHYPIGQLVQAMQNAIRVQPNQANGFFIHTNGGVSLECIVLKYNNFTEDDKTIARGTLGQQTCDR